LRHSARSASIAYQWVPSERRASTTTRATVAQRRNELSSTDDFPFSRRFHFMDSNAAGTLSSINVSDGGVPKLPIPRALVRMTGVESDRQRNLQVHGGPRRAVCLYSLDLILALQAEGHPIGPGTIGENFTIAGVDWNRMIPGALVDIGLVSLELTSYADPCRNIAGSFRGAQILRVSEKRHPGWSRVYARVLTEGTIEMGDPVTVR
jgi:MOSC domain-containing protein YiiM